MAEYPLIELYIDGQWKRASGQPIINPADESVLGTVPPRPGPTSMTPSPPPRRALRSGAIPHLPSARRSS